MDVHKLHNFLPGGLDVPIQDADIRVNVKLDLIRSEDTLQFFDLVPLLVLLVLLVLLEQLPEAQLEVYVIRVNESSLGVISVIVFLTVQFSAAAATSVDAPSGHFPPELDKRDF